MKLTLEKLSSHLEKSLLPLYMVSGDEYLLVQECADLIRRAAAAAGFSDRQRIIADKDFDWQELPGRLDCGSLFSSKSLIDITVPEAKFGDQGTKILLSITENLHPDNIILISTSKIDATRQRSKWYKALEDKGCVIAIWPIESHRLPQWLQQRCSEYQLNIPMEGLKIIADRVEGNLLAAKQELEKLSLIYGNTNITTQQVIDAVANTARFDVFKLIDSALLGDAKRVINILNSLQYQGVEAIFVLWALTRECRLLLSCHYAQAAQQNMEQTFQKLYVWPQRRPLIQNAMKRLAKRDCMKILARAKFIDETIKGARPGSPWRGLMTLYLSLAGCKLSSVAT